MWCFNSKFMQFELDKGREKTMMKGREVVGSVSRETL